MSSNTRDENKMYQFEMPTERLKREFREKLSAKDEQIARLEIRMSALEVFIPEGTVVDEEGTLSVSISQEENTGG